MKGNERLVFDAGNQFSHEVASPYCLFPAYWRGFVFRILKARDLAVYLYVASQCDKHDIAYPSIARIRDDLGISSATTVTSALARLDKHGFLLRTRDVLPNRRSSLHQNIYQRPLPHYTIHRLLAQSLIDGDLQPMGRTRRKHSEPDKAVHMALKKLLGAKYEFYEVLDSLEERTEYLKEQLERILFAKRASGKLAYDVTHGKVAKLAAKRLKIAEDQLLNGLNAVIQRLAPSFHQHPFVASLPNRVRAPGVALRKLVQASDVNGIVEWLDTFSKEVRTLEREVRQYVGPRADDSGPGVTSSELTGEVVLLFDRYGRAVQALQDRVSELSAVPV